MCPAAFHFLFETTIARCLALSDALARDYERLASSAIQAADDGDDGDEDDDDGACLVKVTEAVEAATAGSEAALLGKGTPPRREASGRGGSADAAKGEGAGKGGKATKEL